MKRSVRFKYFSGVLYEVIVSNKNIFEDSPLPRCPPRRKKRGSVPLDMEDIEEGEPSGKAPSDLGRKRAAKRVFDLVACNPDLDLFCTFTLDRSRIDRYDYGVVVKKLNIFLDNHVRRHGLKYVLVAEHHKDGAIHFHALMNRALRMADSGKRDKRGHIVYNLPQWEWGFTTAISCYGKRSHVTKYITKYITKQGEKVGGRWYYHGGKLLEPTYSYADCHFRDDAHPTAGEALTAFPQSADGFPPAFHFVPEEPFIEGLQMFIFRKEEF